MCLLQLWDLSLITFHLIKLCLKNPYEAHLRTTSSPLEGPADSLNSTLRPGYFIRGRLLPCLQRRTPACRRFVSHFMHRSERTVVLPLGDEIEKPCRCYSWQVVGSFAGMFINTFHLNASPSMAGETGPFTFVLYYFISWNSLGILTYSYNLLKSWHSLWNHLEVSNLS